MSSARKDFFILYSIARPRAEKFGAGAFFLKIEEFCAARSGGKRRARFSKSVFPKSLLPAFFCVKGLDLRPFGILLS
ncbi:MAG: hypothetical protein DBY30_02605 [Verrucomicrobia bacterium]|nr:MAG: hypothetical protein DBY30_02605 [Verrucomicrobiota bacterium]